MNGPQPPAQAFTARAFTRPSYSESDTEESDSLPDLVDISSSDEEEYRSLSLVMDEQIMFNALNITTDDLNLLCQMRSDTVNLLLEGRRLRSLSSMSAHLRLQYAQIEQRLSYLMQEGLDQRERTLGAPPLRGIRPDGTPMMPDEDFGIFPGIYTFADERGQWRVHWDSNGVPTVVAFHPN